MATTWPTDSFNVEGETRYIILQDRLERWLTRRAPSPVSPASPADYAIRWEAMQATWREQAAQFDLYQEDRRDASYWEIVTPLFEEAERIVSSS